MAYATIWRVRRHCVVHSQFLADKRYQFVQFQHILGLSGQECLPSVSGVASITLPPNATPSLPHAEHLLDSTQTHAFPIGLGFASELFMWPDHAVSAVIVTMVLCIAYAIHDWHEYVRGSLITRSIISNHHLLCNHYLQVDRTKMANVFKA